MTLTNDVTHECEVIIPVLAISLQSILQLHETFQGYFFVAGHYKQVLFEREGHLIMTIRSLVDFLRDFEYELRALIREWWTLCLLLTKSGSSIRFTLAGLTTSLVYDFGAKWHTFLNLTRPHNTVNLNSFFLQLRRIRPNHTDPSPLKSVSFCIEVVVTSRSDFP